MEEYKSAGGRIYYLWDKYARELDVDGLLSLYTTDATLETPVIAAIYDTDCGMIQGEAELRHFFEEGGRRRPNALVRWHRKPDQYFYDGSRLVWEYPRETPDGNQIEIMEVMDLIDDLICHHRIYWGWFGIQQLIKSAPSKQKKD